LLAALADWLDPAWWWAVLQVVLGLGAVIFVHELGHFLAAKSCGVKCEKFYVGFDAFDIRIGDRVIIPRKLVSFQKGETEYGVGILPLGGYVKMLGQDDNPTRQAEERERAMLAEGDGVDGSRLDPRSYMAKSVPQRMLIISAGVIMNLVFAVIFAAIAFGTGVNYEPAKVGKTVPGSPAWQNRLDGSTINEISGYRTDDPDVYFNFNHLRELIVLDSYDGPLDMEVLRPGAAKPVDLSIAAASNLIGVKGGGNLMSLGIMPMLGTTLSEPATIDGQAASRTEPALQPGDTFLAINGQEIRSGFEMTRLLARLPDQDLAIRVERADGTLVDARMPANVMKSLGLEMELGQVRALRNGSPAAAAGMLPHDQITRVDGQPPGDPFTLQLRMLRKARENQQVTIDVDRWLDDGTRVTRSFTLVPVLPDTPTMYDDQHGITIESLGINVIVKNTVVRVHSSNLDIQQGDRIVSAQMTLNERQSALPIHQGLTEQLDFVNSENLWPILHFGMQSLDPGSKVILKVQRDSTVRTVEATVQTTPFFLETRGFTPVLEQKTYRDASLWAALKNGFRQTIDDASRVLKFLKKLVRGQLSFTNFGGPGTIAVVATSEASQGTSRLLLFLTLLSANLAIINFLPIPVLDGGHMVFLAYEGIFRRPVSERLQLALTIAGFVFLLALMATVIGLDIWRLT
jgi:regulator of sigma E protease